MRLRFIIGTAEEFEAFGIDTETARKSVDKTKVLIHQENLTDVEFNSIICSLMHPVVFGFATVPSFEFKSNEAMEEMLATPEWTVAGEV